MSSYVVLARKWRPRRFEDLIGQEHVVQALRHALDQGRISHAFLFTGIRGIGKTTLSRLLAMCLNCREGVTATPCGTCDSCQAVIRGEHPDVFEVDAASRTKVEQMRELLDGVPYAPTTSAYKVYILDEVHMLSEKSFNAILKTLEEPPAHVKFIFATTEVHKIPPTILSRCQRYDLRRLERGRLSAYLADILGQEEIAFEELALSAISKAADGSVRDGLSLLDQCIAHGGGEVTYARVSDLLGLTDGEAVTSMLADLLKGDAAGMLAGLEQFHRYGVEPRILLDDLLERLHAAAREKAVGAQDRDLALADHAELATHWAKISQEHLQMLYQVLLRGRQDIQLARDGKQALEMLLLRGSCLRPVPPLKNMVDALQRQVEQASGTAAQAAAQPSAASASVPPAAAQVATSPLAEEKKKPSVAPEPTAPPPPEAILELPKPAPSVKSSSAAAAREADADRFAPAPPRPEVPQQPPPVEPRELAHEQPVLPERLDSWDALAQAAAVKQPVLQQKMDSHLSLVSYQGGTGPQDPPRLEVATAHSFAGEPAKVRKQLMDLFASLGVMNPQVKVVDGTKGDRPATRAEIAQKSQQAHQTALEKEITANPLVQKIINHFDADIIHVEPNG
uniref:DNA polymerase III subunit gamma/tau n=1 Tax=Magnetococcus massalia (strain MO-1) TaxID=451514 RepID=A0A1S7LFW2_MAGMO|nr:DNA polymerase III, gamma and tau subunits [Candidatus Magnetococcus massalia]